MYPTREELDAVEQLLDGYALCFLVPTKDGQCNYGCGFCVFKRQAFKPTLIQGPQLTPESIHELIGCFATAYKRNPFEKPVVFLAVQGIQPFADEVSVACVREIFSWHEELAAPCSLVSSGDGIQKNLELLASVRASVAVSIDAERETNAHVRPAVLPNGKRDPDRNSYDTAITGLDAMAEVPELEGRFSVACTVLPGCTHRPRELARTFPQRLLEQPGFRFVFSPYIKLKKRKGETSPLGITREEFLPCFDELRHIADREGFEVYVDDELDGLQLVPDVDVPREQIVPRPKEMEKVRIYSDGKILRDYQHYHGSLVNIEEAWLEVALKDNRLEWTPRYNF